MFSRHNFSSELLDEYLAQCKRRLVDPHLGIRQPVDSNDLFAQEMPELLDSIMGHLVEYMIGYRQIKAIAQQKNIELPEFVVSDWRQARRHIQHINKLLRQYNIKFTATPAHTLAMWESLRCL